MFASLYRPCIFKENWHTEGRRLYALCNRYIRYGWYITDSYACRQSNCHPIKVTIIDLIMQPYNNPIYSKSSIVLSKIELYNKFLFIFFI